MSKSGILDVRLIWEKLRHFFWKLFQVSGPGTNQSWTHTLTIFEVEYYKQIFWYPIGSLHRFKFLLYTSEHPSVKKWSWCFITCRYINIALKWSRNTHHILKSQIWRFLDILSNNLFCINGVWPVVCHLFRGATRRGQNLMNSCTFSYLLWWRGCESNFYAVFRLCWAMLSLSLMMIWTILIMIQLSEWESMIRWKVVIFHDLGGILVRLRVGDDQKGHNGNIQDMRP